MAAIPRVTGTNNASKQVSVNVWNNLAARVEAGGRLAEDDNATGDGATEDGPAIRTSIAASLSVALAGGHTYRVAEDPAATGSSPKPNIYMRSGLKLNGRGATLRLPSGGRGLANDYSSAVSKALASNLAVGATVIPLATGGGASFTAGDEVLYRLGDIPYDTPETTNWGFAAVVSVSADNVTIDRPITQAFTLAGATNNKHLLKAAAISDLCVTDLRIDGVSGCESGITVHYGRRLTFERISGRKTGAGLIVGQYIEGASFRDIECEDNNFTQASYGAAMSFAECRGIVIQNLRTKGMRTAIKAEADAHVSVDGIEFVNTVTSWSGGRTIVINCAGRSSVKARNVTISGYGDITVVEDSNGLAGYGGTVQMENLTLDLATDPYSIPVPGQTLSGTLDMTIAGTREVYYLDRTVVWERTFTLADSELLTVLGPPGLLASLRVFCSSGLTLGTGNQLDSIYIGRSGSNGSNYVSSLVAGSDVVMPLFCGVVEGTHWTYRASAIQALLVTNTGLNGLNKFVRIRATLVPPVGTTYAETDSDARHEGGGQLPVEGSATYDPPLVAAAGTTTTTVTVTGAAVGDFVAAVSLSQGLGGLSIRSAEVTGADTVTVILENNTGAGIDRASGTIRAFVQKVRAGS